MIKGSLIDNKPWIQVTLALNNAVQEPFLVLDTGFSGDLWVTEKIAKELGLKPISVTKARLAGGIVKEVPTANAIAHMEGISKEVNILVYGGSLLVGISFFTKFSYKAIVDCKNRKVALQRMF